MVSPNRFWHLCFVTFLPCLCKPLEWCQREGMLIILESWKPCTWQICSIDNVTQNVIATIWLVISRNKKNAVIGAARCNTNRFHSIMEYFQFLDSCSRIDNTRSLFIINRTLSRNQFKNHFANSGQSFQGHTRIKQYSWAYTNTISQFDTSSSL